MFKVQVGVASSHSKHHPHPLAHTYTACHATPPLHIHTQPVAHPMHFCTSAGLGSPLLLPRKAAPTASCSRTRPEARYASLKGAEASSSSGSWSGSTAGATPCSRHRIRYNNVLRVY